jgi:hypothetical protein
MTELPPAPWPVDIDTYHAVTSGTDDEGQPFRIVSSSTLKAWRTDPRSILVPPKSEPKAKRRDMATSLGQALHDNYLTPTAIVRSLLALNGESREKLCGMMTAIDTAKPGTHGEQIRKLLRTSRGRSEYSYVWIHETGLRVKVRHDRLILMPDETLINFDLKSSRESGPAGFIREAEHWGYYHQADLYERGARVLFPDCPVSTRWGFISTRWPHRMWCPTPDPDKMRQAAEENDKALKSFHSAWLDPKSWRPEVYNWERADGAVPLA